MRPWCQLEATSDTRGSSNNEVLHEAVLVLCILPDVVLVLCILPDVNRRHSSLRAYYERQRRDGRVSLRPPLLARRSQHRPSLRPPHRLGGRFYLEGNNRKISEVSEGTQKVRI